MAESRHTGLLTMVAIRILVGAAGGLLIATTLLSTLRTFVLPRSAGSWMTSLVFKAGRRLFRLVSFGSFHRRDRVLALFVPMTVFALAGVWLVMVIVGYAALFWATGYGPPSEAWWVSGSSLLTLGSAPLESTLHRTMAFSEAAIGFGLVALLVSFLPSLYAAFSRREQAVALLDVRAGTPPSAVEMLSRFERIGWSTQLGDEWVQWESWFADLDESHTTYPMLVWLRSPVPERSWLTAAATVMDAAALRVSTIDRGPDPRAQICIRSGFVALRHIADFFGVAYDPDPAPDDPIAIGRAEYDSAVRALADAGIPLKDDLDQAWRDFAGWRVNYDTVLLRLAHVIDAPTAPWSSDRSPVDQQPTVITRWG